MRHLVGKHETLTIGKHKEFHILQNPIISEPFRTVQETIWKGTYDIKDQPHKMLLVW